MRPWWSGCQPSEGWRGQASGLQAEELRGPQGVLRGGGMRSASRHPHHSVTVTVLPRGVGLVLRPQLLPSARVFKDRNLSLHFDGVVK